MIAHVKIPFLSERKVRAALTMKRAIAVLRQAFKDQRLGKMQMPPKTYLFFEKHQGDLRVMPCYWPRKELACVKLVNAHFLNPKRFGLPSVLATIVVYDPRDGRPICLMEGTFLTAVRTGAAAGLATDLLALRNARTLGLLGAGVQAQMQLAGVQAVRPIERVLCWSLDPEPARRFVRFARRRGAVVELCPTPEKVVRNCDVLCTVTPSRQPIVKRAWVKRALHINAMGADAPGKQELEPQLLRDAYLVVDDRRQTVHGGEINVPIKRGELREDEIAAELADLLAPPFKVKLPALRRRLTIFDSTGLALQDVALASLVVEQARQKGWI